jgi:hypothetical protein
MVINLDVGILTVGNLDVGRKSHSVAELVVHHDLPDDLDGQALPEMAAPREGLQVVGAQLKKVCDRCEQKKVKSMQRPGTDVIIFFSPKNSAKNGVFDSNYAKI